jgi:hypothetical protein
MGLPGGIDKKNLLIYFLMLITVAAVSVTVWALFFRTPNVALAPDYAPVATESHAQPIPNDKGVRPEAEPGSGSVSLTYSNEVVIELSSGKVDLLFANPGRSNQDMVLQIVVQGTVLIQSGRITPGNQVTELELEQEAARLLSPGGYEGSFLIFYYDLSSGEKAMVNTEVPIIITVVE